MLRTFESPIWICRALLVSLVFSSGCASALPRLPETTMPSLHEAYVGGLFRNDVGYHFGFRLMNETTWKTYLLGFGDSSVSIVAVPPGHYRVIHWVAWRADHSLVDVAQDVPSNSELGQHFLVVGGQVVLLGQWFASHIPVSRRVHFTIAASRITEAQAIEAFQGAYLHFLGQRVRCLVCAP